MQILGALAAGQMPFRVGWNAATRSNERKCNSFRAIISTSALLLHSMFAAAQSTKAQPHISLCAVLPELQLVEANGGSIDLNLTALLELGTGRGEPPLPLPPESVGTSGSFYGETGVADAAVAHQQLYPSHSALSGAADSRPAGLVRCTRVLRAATDHASSCGTDCVLALDISKVSLGPDESVHVHDGANVACQRVLNLGSAASSADNTVAPQSVYLSGLQLTLTFVTSNYNKTVATIDGNSTVGMDRASDAQHHTTHGPTVFEAAWRSLPRSEIPVRSQMTCAYI